MYQYNVRWGGVPCEGHKERLEESAEQQVCDADESIQYALMGNAEHAHSRCCCWGLAVLQLLEQQPYLQQADERHHCAVLHCLGVRLRSTPTHSHHISSRHVTSHRMTSRHTLHHTVLFNDVSNERQHCT